MNSLTANEAKTHFGELLLKAQQAPIQINKNGKPAVVVVSSDDYTSIEELKLQLLQLRAEQATAEIAQGSLIDGDAFFDTLDTPKKP